MLCVHVSIWKHAASQWCFAQWILKRLHLTENEKKTEIRWKKGINKNEKHVKSKTLERIKLQPWWKDPKQITICLNSFFSHFSPFFSTWVSLQKWIGLFFVVVVVACLENCCSPLRSQFTSTKRFILVNAIGFAFAINRQVWCWIAYARLFAWLVGWDIIKWFKTFSNIEKNKSKYCENDSEAKQLKTS